MNYLGFMGGLSFFLFGMSIMETGLENISGNKIKKTIKSISDNPIKGVLIGTAVTAVIQSSSAVTVSVIGISEAGLIAFSQAVFIIMGANIGTSVTAWMISLSGLSSDNILLKILNTSNLYPVTGFIGVLFIILPKNNKMNNSGFIMVGFSLLISGIESMSSTMEQFSNSNSFNCFIELLNNPLLSFIIGIFFTAVIQSSSASIGILQSLAATGSISVKASIPFILGINIGTCATAVLACASGSSESKKICAFHIIFNLTGSFIWLIGFYIISSFYSLDTSASAAGISAIHTAFNISTTAIIFPAVIKVNKRLHTADG